jgi:hypothetical protein
VETAADLQASCAVLLPGYSAARREPERFDEIALATLYANAAYKRHLAARGNTQHVRLDPADGDTHERLARQARSWGVELSA